MLRYRGPMLITAIIAITFACARISHGDAQLAKSRNWEEISCFHLFLGVVKERVQRRHRDDIRASISVQVSNFVCFYLPQYSLHSVGDYSSVNRFLGDATIL